jgi:SAM-dependent methyltransferase
MLVADWFENESFWRRLYPFVFAPERMADAAVEIDGVLGLVPNRGQAVLDVCCGPGRHAVELARRGFQVTGVDLSPHLLERAREQADGAGVEVEWVRSDAREFVRPGGFDLAISLFTSFGYFEDPRDDARMLTQVLASLRPGGALLMEMVGKEWLAGGFQPTTAVDGPDGSVLVERHEIVDDWGAIRNEWILIEGDRAERFRFQHRLYSGSELRSLLLDVGFERVLLHGDLDGAPFGMGSSRLITVALKGDDR